VLGNEAFYGSSLRNVYIDNLKSLGGYVFHNCTSLQNVRINSVQTDLNISAETSHFYSNTKIIFSSSNVKESFQASAPTLATKCVLLEVSNKTLTKFEGDLSSLNLSEVFKFNEINKLGDNLLKNNTNLKNLTIGSNITSLGDNVFDGSSVQTLTINSYSAPSISEKTFENIGSTFSVKVPSGVLTIFQTQFEGVNVVAID